jgi:DNA-binding response OmpR family regulator
MAFNILFLEKDLTTAERLVPALKQEGYQVSLARSQHQALSRIRSLRPNILVVDVASFGAGGYGLLDAVRARLHEVPTVLLLAKGDAAARGGGGETCVAPPFTPAKVLDGLGKAAEGLPPREIRAGPLVLDLDTRTLHKGGATFQLRPMEAALLSLFMRNPGRVLSREEIMKKVWKTDFLEDTRTLYVHVRWLRLKVEDDPGAPRTLCTERSVGYRFEVGESLEPESGEL